jgi:hypothetical protein
MVVFINTTLSADSSSLLSAIPDSFSNNIGKQKTDECKIYQGVTNFSIYNNMKPFEKCKSSLGVVNFKMDVIKRHKEEHNYLIHPRTGCCLYPAMENMPNLKWKMI